MCACGLERERDTEEERGRESNTHEFDNKSSESTGKDVEVTDLYRV